jgi:predicted peptidase
MDVIRSQGAQVTTASWDGSLSVDQLDGAANSMASEGKPINYGSFIPGTVLPADGSDNSEHRNTWRVAYTIDALRDWIFQQKNA